MYAPSAGPWSVRQRSPGSAALPKTGSVAGPFGSARPLAEVRLPGRLKSTVSVPADRPYGVVAVSACVGVFAPLQMVG